MVREIAQMASNAFWLWSAILTILALVSLYFAFRNLNRARSLEDTPTSRIRSAHQGYVELIGEAAVMNGEPTISPLSGTPCCWWRYTVEHKDDKGWHLARKDQSENLFLLLDETGECVIDSDGGQISPSEKKTWYGPDAIPSSDTDRSAVSQQSRQARGDSKIMAKNPFSGDYRYTEEIIIPGDPLYAIGLFKSLGDMEYQPIREETIKEQLRQWKADHASLLKRFDRSKESQIDLNAWESTHRVARQTLSREEMKENPSEIHTLSSTGFQRRPLLVSTQEEFDIIQRLRLWTGLSLVGFFVFGAGVAWMLTARFL